MKRICSASPRHYDANEYDALKYDVAHSLFPDLLLVLYLIFLQSTEVHALAVNVLSEDISLFHIDE